MVTRNTVGVLLWAMMGLILAATTHGGEFDRAIETASSRVVKLYGLGAGIQEGYGTGIIVSEDGLVITVLSLLIDARVVKAIAYDGTRFEADVVHRDPRVQLALLRLKRMNAENAPMRDVGPLPFFGLADEASLRPGDWILAAGNPFKIADGAEPVTVAHGVFSGRTRLDARRRVKDFPYRGEVLVIDAITSNPGAPGSALVNLDGELVGMIGRVVLSNMTHTHFNYALPREVLYTFWRKGLEAAARPGHDGDTLLSAPDGEMESDAHRSNVDSGVRLARAGYRKVLPFVERVKRGSAAARAGIRKDDLILSVNGQAVSDVTAYDKRLKALAPDESIELVLRRGRTILTVHFDIVETSSSSHVEVVEHKESETSSQQVRDTGAGDTTREADTSRGPLYAAQTAFRGVAQRLRPSLVRIHTVGGSQPHGVTTRTGPDDGNTPSPFQDSLGSSFVIADGPTTGLVYSSDGYIITSSFNFVREPLLISVTMSDGRQLAADLIARDQVRKLALLKIDEVGLTVPEWVDAAELRVGQWSIALGQAFDAKKPFVTVGIVSALKRMHGNAVQTDAKLSPGNYGGPLCDISGRVMGICVPMAQRPGELAGVEMYDSGVGFALPKWRVDEIVATLKTGRSYYRGWLGISTKRHTSGRVEIADVANPSPMLAAGVLSGDVIIGVEGEEIDNFSHFMKAIYMVPAGEQLHLQLERDGFEFSVMVALARAAELGGFPELPPPPELFSPPDE